MRKRKRSLKMTEKRYETAKKSYEKLVIDTDKALEKLKNVKISVHCWQGDDVGGFEKKEEALSGGILATGNYMGKARNPEELMQDIDKVLSLVPGKHRINLHASYLITDEKVDRDKIQPRHFEKWVEFAKARGLGLDFNPTLFSHDMVKDGLTLSSPDEKVRKFWIDHCKACRKIAEYFGKELGSPCLVNIWIPDGLKDVPGSRIAPRQRLKESLDEIYSVKYDKKYVLDCVESKVFGIGVESYTVGSSEFYMNYAARNDKLCLLDSGHYHPTEVISDKISSLLIYFDKLALHVSRPVRWDSDHVVIFDDELREIAKEIVACDALDKVMIALDYFDASINRIAAWTIGIRNMQKALLYALLLPVKEFKQYQDRAKFTKLLAMQEEMKTYPFGDVWNYFCEKNGAPVGEEWIEEVEKYEREVLSKR